MAEDDILTIRDAHIIYRNFEGRETQYNRAGSREFSIVLSPQDAEKLINDGWNVKVREPLEEGDDPFAYLTVSVAYKMKPPRVTLLTSTTRTTLSEKNIEVLDFADIEKADLTINPYDWEVGGKTGRKAYLKTLFVTIREDELEREYGVNGIAGAEDNDG